MGNGNDTLLLSGLCGEKGRVLAFDIQEMALANTKARLTKENAPLNYRLIQDSHANLTQYAEEETADCIVFNFGYLPGGDHNLATKADTSIQAMEKALTLLKKAAFSRCVSTAAEIPVLRSGTQSLTGCQTLIFTNIWSSKATTSTVPTIRQYRYWL